MAGSSLEPGQTGASSNQRKRKAPALTAAAEEEAEQESVDELEREVADLDRRILAHVHGTATRLSDVLPRLSALRPPACTEIVVASETSVAEADQDLEKLKILKSKVQANIAYMPKVLEKLKETLARCEKFMDLNVDVNVDSVFRRRL